MELVWNGKTSEVCNIVLPFQIIEQVDNQRIEKPQRIEPQIDAKTRKLENKKGIGVHSRPSAVAEQLSLFGFHGRQLKGWTNKLIVWSIGIGIALPRIFVWGSHTFFPGH